MFLYVYSSMFSSIWYLLAFVIIKTKKCVIKRKLKFENYKNCLKANQLHNKIKHLEKNKINIDSFKKL